MNDKQIEGCAVDVVKATVRKSGNLDPLIPENDKEPIWDGAINIYKNNTFSNENFIARVPVQVKGTTKAKFQRNLKYQVKITYLKNFLNDGGAIFFVVYINAKDWSTEIYYLELAPINIKSYLNEIGKQKSINLKFKPFPKNTSEIESLLMNFSENCKNQLSYVRNNMVLSFPDLVKHRDEIIRIHAPLYIRKDINVCNFFVTKETYLYAETRNLGKIENIPILCNGIKKIAKEISNIQIKVKDRVYYTFSERTFVSDNYFNINIGKGMKIVFNGEKEEFNISYANPKFVREICRDLEFWRDAVLNEGFTFGDYFVSLPKDKLIANGFNLKNIDTILSECKKYEQILDFFNCDKDFEYLTLTPKNRSDLNVLYSSLIKNQEICLTDDADCLLVSLKIQNLTFMVIAKRSDKKRNFFKIEDYFSDKIITSVKFKDEPLVELPQFCFLRKEDLISVDNLCMEKILPAIKQFKISEYLLDFSAGLVKNLCEAFKDTKRGCFLNVAKDLTKWLYKNIKEDENGKRIKVLLEEYKYLRLPQQIEQTVY